MYAITTKYLGHRARIEATYAGNRNTVTIEYPYDLSEQEAHAQAAMMLAAELGCHIESKWVAAETLDGYVFVFVGAETYSPLTA